MAERFPDRDAREWLQLKEKQKMKTIRKAQRPWLQFGQDGSDYDPESLRVMLASHKAVSWRSR